LPWALWKKHPELISNVVDDTLLRVILTPFTYYNFAFSDDNQWHCFKGTNPSWDTPLYFYYPIGSPLPKYATKKQGAPFIVTIKSKSPEKRGRGKQFLIGKGWIDHND